MTNQTYSLCTLCLSVYTLYSFTYTRVFYCYVFYNIGTALQVGRSRVWFSIGIFHWHNPSGRTLALGLTQPLTEMSTRNISLG